MVKVFNIATMLLLVFFSVKTFALESTDRFNTQILKIYNRNILVLNRGLEDGIIKKDHAKLSSADGFIARGICVQATLLTSHWKIYRVVRPELVSKDTIYRLRSINQSEIPTELRKYVMVDFSKYYNEFGDEDVNKQLVLQEKRIAEYDLPNDVAGSRALKKPEKSHFDELVEKTFKEKEIQADLTKVYLNFFASPISWQTRYDQKETHYGAKFYNIGAKYQFELLSIEHQRKIVDPVSKQSYNSKSSYHSATFQFNRFTENFSLVSFASFNKEKIGNTYYPYSYVQMGVLGLKYHFWEKDPKNDFFEISYTPSFDSIDFTDPMTNELQSREGIRHLFKLKLHSFLSPKLQNKFEFIYAPLARLSSSNFDYEDTKVQINTTFSYDLGGKFYWDYLVNYEQDDLRAEVYGISANNTIQTFRLRYEMEI